MKISSILFILFCWSWYVRQFWNPVLYISRKSRTDWSQRNLALILHVLWHVCFLLLSDLSLLSQALDPYLTWNPWVTCETHLDFLLRHYSILLDDSASLLSNSYESRWWLISIIESYERWSKDAGSFEDVSCLVRVLSPYVDDDDFPIAFLRPFVIWLFFLLFLSDHGSSYVIIQTKL